MSVLGVKEKVNGVKQENSCCIHEMEMMVLYRLVLLWHSNWISILENYVSVDRWRRVE